MNLRILSQIATVGTALLALVGLRGSATGDARSEAQHVPDQSSTRSSPPDLTHYVRPVIPEDRIWSPSRTQSNTRTPALEPKMPVDNQPREPEQRGR
jgi:hypothetical protein